MPTGDPNITIHQGEGHSRLIVKEYDIRFTPGGNANSLHNALNAFLFDMENVIKIQQGTGYRFNNARAQLKNNTFAFPYRNQKNTMTGNLVVSIRDTKSQKGILTIQLWESLIHPKI